MRKYLAALFLALSLSTAFAQPPPVPALPDTERRTSYIISATTCACNVNFALYGDSTDIDSWIEVWISGVRYLSTDPSFGWALSSATGPLATIPRPITNAVLTFNAVQTGTVQIVGANRPRRLSQFAENRGVAARDLNQVLTGMIAQNRETWDKINDVTGRGLFSQPGNTVGPLPLPALCANGFLGFDATGLIPQCSGTGPGSGNVVGPVSSTNNNFVLWNGTSGAAIKDAGYSTVPVTSGGTGLTGGTSGGIPFFSGASAITSSGLLTQFGLVYGGGAGGAPVATAAMTDGQLLVGQTAAAPLPKTISGDVTFNAAGATAIGATKVTSAMLNSDVFSTAHSWGGQQSFTAPILGTPASGTLTNATGLPISTGVAGLGTGVATAAANPVNASGGFTTFGNAFSLTPGAGLVSSTTANCSQTAIAAASGTISRAECVNAQTGTTYAILDGDRAKLITATNASAQAYSIAQASTAGLFFAGWHADIQNNSTNPAGIVTITPATSQICALGTCAATAKIQPGQFARIVSDGTNYQVIFNPSASQLPGSATNDSANAGNLGESQQATVASGSAVSLTSGAAADITTLPLTAGDWEVSANIYYTPGATTNITVQICSISATLNTLDLTTLGAANNQRNGGFVPGAGGTTNCLVGPMRVSLSGSTTYHLVTQANFTVSTLTGYGIIRARRVR